MPYYGTMHVVIDIGGTKTEVAFYKTKTLDSLTDSFVIPTAQDYTNGRATLFAGIKQRLQNKTVESVGVSFPGIVDPQGTSLWATNLPDYNDKPLKADLEARFKAETIIMQDAVCSAVAEYMYGDIKQYHKVVHLILGTGLGGTFMQLSKDSVAISPIEPGGMVVDLHARPHGFVSAKGLLEAYVGGGNVESFYKVKLADVPDKDKIWDEVTDYLAAGINNLNCLFKPDHIIIGGGIGFKRQAALQPVVKKAAQYAEFVPPTKVAFTKVSGNSSLAGALGASFLTKDLTLSS